MTTYAEKLLDPRWQRRRLEILARAEFSCEHCQDDTSTLHVHHKHYRSRTDPWDYADHELVALCWRCHEDWHEVRSELDVALASIPLGCLDMREVVALVAGYIVAQGPDIPSDVDRLMALPSVLENAAAFAEGRTAVLMLRELRRIQFRKIA